MNAPVVIIGTGLAGYNVAREFRKLDSETPLLLITADDGRSYSKPMLSTGFGKNKEADGLSMAEPGAMAEQLKARELTPEEIIALAEQALNDKGLRADDVQIRDGDTLLELSDSSKRAVILVAAWLGQARLIDNKVVELA